MMKARRDAGDQEAALELAASYEASCPVNTLMRWIVFDALEELGRWEEALEVVGELRANDPPDLDYWEWHPRVASRLDRVEEAAADYQPTSGELPAAHRSRHRRAAARDVVRRDDRRRRGAHHPAGRARGAARAPAGPRHRHLRLAPGLLDRRRCDHREGRRPRGDPRHAFPWRWDVVFAGPALVLTPIEDAAVRGEIVDYTDV